MSLVVVLPAEPVIADDGNVGRARARAGRGRARAAVVSATRTSGQARRAGDVALRRRPRRAPRAARLGQEVVAVEARARDRPRRARPGASVRESIETPATARSGAAGHAAPAGGLRRRSSRLSVGAESATAAPLMPFPPGREAAEQDVARHLAVVEGHGAVAQHLVGLVALARDHDHVAGPRHLERARDGVAPVHDHVALGLRARPVIPRRISSRIASGGSLRGLSEVTITTSESRDATAPMSGRLVRSRSPPQPKTVMTRRGPELAHGLQQVLERVVGVGVVHDHREVLARRPRAPGGRARRRSEARPARPRPRGDAEGQAGAERRQHVLHVEAAERAASRPRRRPPACARGSACRRARARCPRPGSRPARSRRVGPARGRARRAASSARAVVVGVHDRAAVRAQQRARTATRLASKYASMSPWKSRWSRVRLVKTATSNAQPWTRFSSSECDETSSTAWRAAARPPSRGTAPGGRRPRASCAPPRSGGRRSGTGPCRARPTVLAGRAQRRRRSGRWSWSCRSCP